MQAHERDRTGGMGGGGGKLTADPPRVVRSVDRWRSLVAALGAVALLAGCTADDGSEPSEGTVEAPETDDREDGDAQDTPDTPDEPDTPGASDAVGLVPVARASTDDVPTDIDLDALEGLPVLSALAWTMRAVGPDGPPTEPDVEAALHAIFLAEVSAADFVTIASQLQSQWRVTGLEEVTPTELEARISDGTQEMHLVLVVEEEPLAITGMLFQPPLPDPTVFDDWDDVESTLTAVADEVRYLVARVDDSGTCEPIAGSDADGRGPLGSTFKLYVLGAVIDGVADGDLAWEDELEITTELVSHPSGVLQNEDPGTLVSVADAAELMISISDNTATDLLIDAVGRDAVEAAMADLGHRDPAVNQPFITTREMFQLAASPEHTRRFVAADEPGRRAVLAELADAPLPPLAALGFDPHVPHEPEWYASPAELCDALVALDEATSADGMEPGRAAFGAEPPPRIDDDWTPIGGKGGSQPGVQAHTALYERDGERYVFAVTLDHSAQIDQPRLLPALEGVIAFTAEQHDRG